MAADLARRQMSVIATAGNNAGLAAKAATTVTPIVFCVGGDPVGLGLVGNLANPGANVTGATRMHVELGPKRLQLMHEMVPTATSMALLVNPTTPATAQFERKLVEAAAGALGLELHVLEASDERGPAHYLSAMRRSSMRGLIKWPLWRRGTHFRPYTRPVSSQWPAVS